ncbi:hypothetical protein [Sphingobium yanoikuyae]|nr:hypothetical protein [Sphingobium yanoikuyae]
MRDDRNPHRPALGSLLATGYNLPAIDHVPALFQRAHKRLMAANYNRPKPIDPIWYRKDCYLRIQCDCGRRVVAPLGEFVRSRRVHFDTRIYELIARLRCSQCRRKPYADVSRYRSGN